MKRLFIFLFFFVFCTYLYAKYKPKRDIEYLPKLEVVNKNLFSILDSIIDLKSEVQYFKDGNLFEMWFGTDSIRTDLIVVLAAGKNVYGANHDLGLFDYKGNTFLVRGGSLDTTILVKTKIKRKFDFSRPKIKYSDDGTPVFNWGSIHNDIWCEWTCRYKNNKFKLLSFSSFDDKVMSFDKTNQEYR
jgi:hypothetical protein